MKNTVAWLCQVGIFLNGNVKNAPVKLSDKSVTGNISMFLNRLFLLKLNEQKQMFSYFEMVFERNYFIFPLK
jgi:hypothetical protein